MRGMLRPLVCFIAAACALTGADEYSGPKPPKPDIPYLLHADNLVETEVAQATETHSKNELTFTVPGASSPVKTPLAEPIFIMQSKQLSPDTMQVFKFSVVNGNRVVMIGKKHHTDAPVHISVKNLGEGLYRIQVSDTLENGEYSLSPSGSNAAFCFSIVD